MTSSLQLRFCRLPLGIMDARNRQREDAEEAYQIQAKAAVEVCVSA